MLSPRDLRSIEKMRAVKNDYPFYSDYYSRLKDKLEKIVIMAIKMDQTHTSIEVRASSSPKFKAEMEEAGYKLTKITSFVSPRLEGKEWVDEVTDTWLLEWKF